MLCIEKVLPEHALALSHDPCLSVQYFWDVVVLALVGDCWLSVSEACYLDSIQCQSFVLGTAHALSVNLEYRWVYMACVVFELSHGVSESMFLGWSQIICIFRVNWRYYRHFNLTCLIHFLLQTSALVVLRLANTVKLEVASVSVGAKDVTGNYTEVSWHKLLVFLHGQGEELLAVFYVLSLNKLFNHLSVEHILYGSCVHFVLVFATVQHSLDCVRVLYSSILRQLEVSFPSFTSVGEVLVLLLDTCSHLLNRAFVTVQTRFKVCHMGFIDIYTLEQKLLDFKTTFFHQFLCLINEFLLFNAHRLLILIVLYLYFIFFSSPIFIFFLEAITVISRLLFEFVILSLDELGHIRAIHGFSLEFHLKIEAHSRHFGSAFFVFILFLRC